MFDKRQDLTPFFSTTAMDGCRRGATATMAGTRITHAPSVPDTSPVHMLPW
mgnify:CR=1 FL=1